MSASALEARLTTTTTSQGLYTENMEESTKVWYADGTLILRAGNTLFSVYSGIMAQRSAVFEDMFSTAQPNPDETHNGKPVVELFDDPEDLVDFLKSIHDHE